MTLNQLTYFCMLAKTQSYTQAAQALFIAQPSLSYAISTLEKELGCLLVAREGRRISLTPAGETFYRYPKAALEARRASGAGRRSVRDSGTSGRRLRDAFRGDQCAEGKRTWYIVNPFRSLRKSSI